MKKTIHLFIYTVIGCFLLFCLAICIRTHADDIPNNTYIEDFVIKEADKQTDALEAYSRIWDSFQKDGEGFVVYPDEYAGGYIEDNKLYIALVDLSNNVVSKYKSLCGDISCVEFVRAEYSLKELQEYDKLANDFISRYSIISFGIDQKNNLYEICVKDKDLESVTKEIEDLDLGKAIVVKSSNEAVLCANIYGGHQIDKMGTSGSYSACIGGYYNGQEALLTAGHYNEGYPSFCRSGNYIGQVSFQRCNTQASNTGITSYGDFAIITMSGNYVGTNKVISSLGGTLSITGTMSTVPEGAAIFKYGYATGYSWGNVTMVGETVVIYEGNNPKYIVRGLTRSSMQNSSQTNAVYLGDSGGTVYVYNNGKYKLQGSVHGFMYASQGQPISVMRSSPIYYPVNAGFTPKTN